MRSPSPSPVRGRSPRHTDRPAPRHARSRRAVLAAAMTGALAVLTACGGDADPAPS